MGKAHFVLAIAAAAAFAAPAAPAADRSGKEVVETVCSGCHAAGLHGAPKIGDREAWIPRLRQGLESIVSSAIRGHGKMPARGGMAALTDGEIRAAVTYMFTGGKAAAAAVVAAPSRDPNRRVVGNIEIHLGVMSAEAIGARYPKPAPPGAMHGGIPSGKEYYHVNVSLVDRKTASRIRNAKVEARVATPLVTETRALEPMGGADDLSYGNYFRMPGKEPYAITVRVSRPGVAGTVDTTFEPRKY